MSQSLAIPRVIPEDWKRLDLIVNKIKMRLGSSGSPTFVGVTVTGLTASTLIGADADKALESVTIGTGLDYTRPTLSLSHLSIELLTDPDADRMLFWDDSATACGWLVPNTLISITGTNLNVDNDLHNYDWTNVDATDLKVGSITQAFDVVLDDISALAVVADNEFIVGTGAGVYAHESGAVARTSIGLGTTDIPQFTGLGLGEAGAAGEIQITYNTSNLIRRVDIENTNAGNAARAGFIARTSQSELAMDAFGSGHAQSNRVVINAITDTDFYITVTACGGTYGDMRFQNSTANLTLVAATSLVLDGAYFGLANFNELRFYDDGANYVGFEAPALTANQIWVLPTIDGGAGELLRTDGGGNLSWTATAPPGAHYHDGDTLQHDAVNSDAVSFAFNTGGTVTFNESITMSAGKDLTIAGHIIFNTNNSYIGFTDPRITFNDIANQLDITGKLILPDNGYFGAVSATTALQILPAGDIILTNSLYTNTGLYLLERADDVGHVATWGHIWVKNDAPNTLWFTDDVGNNAQLGLIVGTDVQAHGDILDDLDTLGANAADSEFLVGTGAGALAWESGATARTSIGLGTGDSPQFTGLTLTGNMVIPDGGTIGQAAGPLLTFNDTTNVLGLTGGRFGLGSAISYAQYSEPLEVNATGNYGGIASFVWSNAAGPCTVFSCYKSKSNTIGIHSAMVENDLLGIIIAQGSDGVQFRQSSMIQFEIDGPVTGGGALDMPGRIKFFTAQALQTPSIGLCIDSHRNLRIGGAAMPTGGYYNLCLKNGLAPSASIADGSILYSIDISASGVLHLRNESGDIIKFDQQNKADHNDWAALSDVVQALVDMGIFDAA